MAGTQPKNLECLRERNQKNRPKQRKCQNEKWVYTLEDDGFCEKVIFRKFGYIAELRGTSGMIEREAERVRTLQPLFLMGDPH
ncbi:hypothetical protein RUM43_012236 [Polyplax serrata]|uniref:Uncharacterized protein n=1 Tax=Polyplax serrata TaxID=468196 RepID=A0AAN8NRA0_POLSC